MYLPYKVVYSLLFLFGVISTPLIFNLVFTTHRGVVMRTLITPGMNIYRFRKFKVFLTIHNTRTHSSFSSNLLFFYTFFHFSFFFF